MTRENFSSELRDCIFRLRDPTEIRLKSDGGISPKGYAKSNALPPAFDRRDFDQVMSGIKGEPERAQRTKADQDWRIGFGA